MMGHDDVVKGKGTWDGKSRYLKIKSLSLVFLFTIAFSLVVRDC